MWNWENTWWPLFICRIFWWYVSGTIHNQCSLKLNHMLLGGDLSQQLDFLLHAPIVINRDYVESFWGKWQANKNYMNMQHVYRCDPLKLHTSILHFTKSSNLHVNGSFTFLQVITFIWNFPSAHQNKKSNKSIKKT